MINDALYSSATDQWNTPTDLLADIAAFFGGDFLDPCPGVRPAGFDGLAVSWVARRVYMNPPYGRSIGVWVQKALSESTMELVMLVPARTDTAWFQPLFGYPICFLRGRLHFNDAHTGAPFPSALVYRGPRASMFADAFGDRGQLVIAAPLGKRWRAAVAQHVQSA